MFKTPWVLHSFPLRFTFPGSSPIHKKPNEILFHFISLFVRDPFPYAPRRFGHVLMKIPRILNAECIVELRLWSTSTQYPRNVGQRADYCRLSFWLGQISQSVSSASRQFAERKPGVLPVYWKPWLKPIKQWLWLWAFSGYGPDDWWVPSSGSNYVSGLAFVDRYSILFSSPIFFSFWVYLTLSSV